MGGARPGLGRPSTRGLGEGGQQRETRQVLGGGTGNISTNKSLVGGGRGHGILEEDGEGGLQHPPAFLVVKYIIRFFFFPERLPHRVPGHREMGE